jgi:hypothetical protein
VLDADKIDHPDRPETTEGHHADHNTNDIGPDQRREDEGQRAAYTPRCRPHKDCHSVDRSRDGRARAGARQQDSTRWETQIGFGRRGKGLQCHARPRAATKSSHKQICGGQTQRAKPGPGRACSRPGHRQNPTGTIRGMSKRSPEPCRHGGTAPYPCGTDPGARRQTLRDTDRNGAGTRDSLTRVVGRSPARDVARLRSANPDGIPAWTEEDAARFSAEREAARVTHPTSASSDLLRSAPRVG